MAYDYFTVIAHAGSPGDARISADHVAVTKCDVRARQLMKEPQDLL